jgi:hypothetical protein
MSLQFRSAKYYGSFMAGMYEYLRTPPPASWEAVVRDGLGKREIRFLDTLHHAVFANPRHPYHQMFRVAGCTYGDLADAVKRDGIEATLATLHRQGVWLSHDEFKGKTEIVRSGQRIEVGTGRFSNPLVQGKMERISGGSRSQGTWTRINTAHRIHAEAYHRLTILEFGLADRHHLVAWPILPDDGAMSQSLRHLRLGGRVDRWFSNTGSWGDSTHYRIGTNGCVMMARAFGHRMPFPTYLPRNDLTPVAEWIARRRSEGIHYSVGGTVSMAVRIAGAALEKGLDIQGTLFLMGSETLTAAKRAAVEATGAQIFSRYATTELGTIGFACRGMKDNCVHLFRDSVALIAYARPAPFSEFEVNALLVTTLTPYAPHILINAEFDDSGVIEPARCDCAYAAAGFTEQIRDISSFGKLTGQGMTLVGTDIVRVLEEVLPTRFGGGPGDYQLVEREGRAQAELSLRVSPRVRLGSPDAVKECFLTEIRKMKKGAVASRVLKYAEAVEVLSAQPISTRAGKVLALHLLGNGSDPLSESRV